MIFSQWLSFLKAIPEKILSDYGYKDKDDDFDPLKIDYEEILTASKTHPTAAKTNDPTLKTTRKPSGGVTPPPPSM